MIRFIGQLYDNHVGFGFVIEQNEKTIRVAIKIKNNSTIEDFKKLWLILAMAIEDPLNPKFKPAVDYEVLCGNEIDLDAFFKENQIPDTMWRIVG